MIGSVSGTRPSPGTAAYGAAKAGLHHLVTSLAIEWAPRVRLNFVAPGLRRDRRQRTATTATSRSPRRSPRPCRYGGWRPRPTSPARAMFLASPQAAYVCGATLLVHGGGEPPFLAAARGSCKPGGGGGYTWPPRIPSVEVEHVSVEGRADGCFDQATSG